MGIKLSNAKMKLGNRTPLISNPFNIVTNYKNIMNKEVIHYVTFW